MNIVTRASKGSKLTHAELDGNFTQLAQAITGLGGSSDFVTSTQVDAKIAAAAVNYVTPAILDSRIQAIIGTAPANLDTLGEIATQLQNDQNASSAIITTLATKANTDDVNAALNLKADKTQVTADIAAAKTKAVTLTGDVSGTANQDANGNISVAVTLAGDTVNNKGNMTGAITLNYADGNYVVGTVTGALNLSLGTIADNTRAYGITIELTNGGANVTWPGNIAWVGGAAPTLRAVGINIITLITRNGGSSWIGMSS